MNRLVGARSPSHDTRQIGALDSQRLARAFEFIESRLDSDVRMSEIASELVQDIRTVTRAFRASTRLAPFEYLTVRRMERAKQLLLTRLEITAIAAEVGYSNPSKFAAAFRRVCGCSPTDWRRRNRSI
ncbi:helix-turn-helix domain-containing protein [Hyphomicrobium sp. 99]|uniref:helix-turn-helix domain-containing protein n=1 Tax=Hyphomicrobium sp. 99 TaxID=1163419 RepID=UPI0018CE7F5B|nr:AraC family transcriptional regulator [Hyphomicrobium sp. 99]